MAGRLGLSGSSVIAVGDDCAAIPDHDGFLLLAIEGFMNEFVKGDPWFAGWCGVMVNISDVAAMGGRPIAVVNAIWADGADAADPVLRGLRGASEAYGVPIVGGHTNLTTDRGQLSVAMLGRAKRLLTSFDATPDDRLIAADRPAWPLPRAVPELGSRDPRRARAAAGRSLHPAGNRRSRPVGRRQGHQPGRCRRHRRMLAECSEVGVKIDVNAVPKPEGVALDRWLAPFPSFGYLLSVSPPNVGKVLDRFRKRGIAAADIGAFRPGTKVDVTDGADTETIWDFSTSPLIGCASTGALT